MEMLRGLWGVVSLGRGGGGGVGGREVRLH